MKKIGKRGVEDGYDAQYVYVLARWVDPTPMSNPGNTAGEFGWDGDCLQVRFIFKDNKVHTFNCWKGADGKDVVQGYPEGNRSSAGTDMKPDGIEQAFTVDADGKGYAQEIAIPWALLTPDGAPLQAGDTFTMNVEPNFSTELPGVFKRKTIKGIWKEGVVPDRVFTFKTRSAGGRPRSKQRAPSSRRPCVLPMAGACRCP